jgi:elongation factor Ts
MGIRHPPLWDSSKGRASKLESLHVSLIRHPPPASPFVCGEGIQTTTSSNNHQRSIALIVLFQNSPSNLTMKFALAIFLGAVASASAFAPLAPAFAPKSATVTPTSLFMGEVTPKTIKELRDNTGAGMMDCKKALIESDGDQEAAAELLRKKGLSTADKKASRVAAEGKIVVSTEGSKAVMVEVNCETDFVAKDDSFLSFCDKVAGAAIGIEGDDVESLMSTEVGGEALESTRQAMVAKIGENIQVRRMSSRGAEGSTVGAYVHMNRIGVLVEIEGGSESLCTDVAMHIAAMNPPFAVAEEVPADVLDRERKILTEQALESGKPAEIVEKMVEGRIRKYLEEICLVSQNFVKDNGVTVGKYLEDNGAKMIGFSRIVVGEGIEKKEDDFAAEVAKMAGGSS